MRAKLCAGDLVEVRSKQEILSTLDRHGQLRGLSFMPEMFQHCGKQFRVYKRAHKTCDTVNNTGGRRVGNGEAVHLEGIRCGGDDHGGCQAACLIFWWQDWLTKIPEAGSATGLPASAARGNATAPAGTPGCTEQEVLAGTLKSAPGAPAPVYSCQVTQLPQATTYLPWWDVRQYIEDYSSGNVSIRTLLRGLLYASVYSVYHMRGGSRLLHVPFWYDRFQALAGGVRFPRRRGTIPRGQRTPSVSLGLQAGDLVRVRTYEFIVSTLDQDNKNRGLYFDAEMVPFCGGTYRVLRRVSQIIDEKTGRMNKFKSDAIMLENVCCQSRYSDRRMFCPRAIPAMWKEIWLERADHSQPGSGCSEAPKPTALTIGARSRR